MSINSDGSTGSALVENNRKTELWSSLTTSRDPRLKNHLPRVSQLMELFTGISPPMKPFARMVASGALNQDMPLMAYDCTEAFKVRDLPTIPREGKYCGGCHRESTRRTFPFHANCTLLKPFHLQIHREEKLKILKILNLLPNLLKKKKSKIFVDIVWD